MSEIAPAGMVPADIEPPAFIFGDPDIDFFVRISPQDGNLVHVVIEVTKAGSADRARRAAAELADLFAMGRMVYWRAEPEGDEQYDFSTGEITRCGYARFSFVVPEKGFGT